MERTALKRSAITKHNASWCFHPFSDSLKKTTLTYPGIIDVCAWHFFYHWQRWERKGARGWRRGFTYKTLPMSGVSGWKAERKISRLWENGAKSSSAMLCSRCNSQPVKQAAHALADHSLEGVSVDVVIQPFFHACLRFSLIITHANGLKSMQRATGRKPESILWQPVLKHHCLSMKKYHLEWT